MAEGYYHYFVHARTARGKQIPGINQLTSYGRSESQALNAAKTIAREHPDANVAVQVEWR